MSRIGSLVIAISPSTAAPEASACGARRVESDSGSAAQPPQEPREERPGGAAGERLSRDIAALVQRQPISTTLAVIALCDVTSTVLATVPSRRQAFRLWRRFVWVMLRDGVLRRPFPRRKIRD